VLFTISPTVLRGLQPACDRCKNLAQRSQHSVNNGASVTACALSGLVYRSATSGAMAGGIATLRSTAWLSSYCTRRGKQLRLRVCGMRQAVAGRVPEGRPVRSFETDVVVPDSNRSPSDAAFAWWRVYICDNPPASTPVMIHLPLSLRRAIVLRPACCVPASNSRSHGVSVP
jgi:hypothetical protein